MTLKYDPDIYWIRLSLSIVTKVQIYWAIQTRARDNTRGSVNVSIDQLSAENVKNSPTNDKYPNMEWKIVNQQNEFEIYEELLAALYLVE